MWPINISASCNRTLNMLSSIQKMGGSPGAMPMVLLGGGTTTWTLPPLPALQNCSVGRQSPMLCPWVLWKCPETYRKPNVLLNGFWNTWKVSMQCLRVSVLLSKYLAGEHVAGEQHVAILFLQMSQVQNCWQPCFNEAWLVQSMILSQITGYNLEAIVHWIWMIHPGGELGRDFVIWNSTFWSLLLSAAWIRDLSFY